YLKTISKTRQTEVLIQVLNHGGNDKSLLGSFYPLDSLNVLIGKTELIKSDIENGIQEAIKKRKSKVFSFKNSQLISFEILVELIRPKVKLICIGDNYDVNAFVSIVHELGWEVHVAGKLRKLNKQIFDLSESVCTYEEASKIPIDKQTAVVLMSHDYKTDFTLLQHYLNTEVLYIGLLGPKKRMIKMQNELRDNGSAIDLEALPNLFAPVGLDIGAESPEEIALSIAAEIVSTLRERDGGALRNRVGPIHERDA
ncbi:MAG: xanthine dehydrogenase accessory factor, partial [Saprospiraceae bacterium]